MVESAPERFKIIMRHLLPAYGRSMYKGCGGKVATFGGSATYTGAPYFCAMAALRSGAELSHIYTVKDAVIPIKSYSPEVMVHVLETNRFK